MFQIISLLIEKYDVKYYSYLKVINVNQLSEFENKSYLDSFACHRISNYDYLNNTSIKDENDLNKLNKN